MLRIDKRIEVAAGRWRTEEEIDDLVEGLLIGEFRRSEECGAFGFVWLWEEGVDKREMVFQAEVKKGQSISVCIREVVRAKNSVVDVGVSGTVADMAIEVAEDDVVVVLNVADLGGQSF